MPVSFLPFVKILPVIFLAGLLGALGAHEVKPLTPGELEEYELDPAFYKKGTWVQGILIATSGKVSDYAHLEAAYQFEMMMKSINPEVAQRVRERKVLCLLVSGDQVLAGLGGGSIVVKSAHTWETARTLTGHTTFVDRLAVCGNSLVSCSDDKTVRVWS